MYVAITRGSAYLTPQLDPDAATAVTRSITSRAASSDELPGALPEADQPPAQPGLRSGFARDHQCRLRQRGCLGLGSTVGAGRVAAAGAAPIRRDV